ncbi:MAG: magnesium transporter [Deltaproteobacteria bacterium]|nr:magnesium transporter [Deltaproteobacteria bacterium]
MVQRDYDELINKIEDLISSQQIINLYPLLEELYPTDIAYIASHVSTEYRLELVSEIRKFKNLDEIICEMDEDIIVEMIRGLEESRIEDLFSKLDPDDTAKVISFLPDDLSKWIFTHMKAEDTIEAEALLLYKEEQAGRIMSTDYFSMTEEATVFQAFNALKNSHDAEMVYYIYIIDKHHHLVGVASLRELLTKPNYVKMKEIMNTDLISVPGEMDQEDVAQIVERYNLVAVPVVNKKNQLVGIITVDDIIDVIRHEATEDIMKLAGTNEKEFYLQSPYKGFLRRMPWLLVSFFGGLLTIQSNILFSGKITNIELMAFITIIAGMGGNIGSQSSTIVVRGLATGKILVTELWSVLYREVAIGILLGIFFGIILGLVATFQFYDVSLIGFSVGIGMLTSMFIAAFIGSLMPIVFQRLNIDPAVATGPFVSTTIDNLGLLSYFISTMTLIHLLT